MRLDICLATYNGAPWIGEFLNSLDAQTYANWRLIVSDDDSQDNTVDLIRDHFVNIPGKLMVVERDSVRAGVIKNFQDAIKASDADYILLADQDDVWVPEKIEVLYETMCNVEQGQRNIPTLVFSDLDLVDEQLQSLDRSWLSFSSASPSWAISFGQLLCQNVVPGCSMMLNRSLTDLSLPFPPKIIMHDWWLLLICSAFGKVGFCPDRLVRYRRHIDAHTYLELEQEGPMSRLYRYLSGGFAGRKTMRDMYERTVLQARLFAHTYKNHLEGLHEGGSIQKVLEAYMASLEKGWLLRRWLLMKHHIRYSSLLDTVKFYIYI